MPEAERMETLRAFGFGTYASRAYLALVGLGASDARAVSREARIPAPKVYATLDQLMERGLARLIVDSPRRYAPVPFDEYLAQQRERHLVEAARLATLAPTLGALFVTSTRKEASDRGGVQVQRGRSPVARLHRQLAARARSQIILCPSVGSWLRLPSLTALLADVASADLRARVLVAGKVAAGDLERLDPLCELRRSAAAPQGVESVSIACFDASEAVLTHHVPDDDSVTEGHDLAIHITQEAIAKSIHEGLLARWEAAGPGGAVKGPKRRRS